MLTVPKTTDEWRMSVEFVRVTFRIAMSLTTGAEMVVMRRRMEAMRMKRTPTLSRMISCCFVDIFLIWGHLTNEGEMFVS